MRIFLSGADTFVGAHVAAQLLDAGHDLRVLTPLAGRCEEALAAHGFNVEELERTDTLHLVEGGITDPRAVVKALVGCDAVMHLASLTAPQSGRRSASAHTTEVIVSGTQNVINSALDQNTGPISICSPISVLAPYRRPTISPDDPPGIGSSPRLQALIAADNYARLRQAGGDPVTVTYTSTPVGPIDPYRSIAAQSLCNWLTRGMPVSTNARVAWVDVRDLAQTLRHSLTTATLPDRYLAFGHLVDLRTLATTIDKVTGQRIRKIPTPRLGFDAIGLLGSGQRILGRDAMYDRQRMAELYDWKPGDQTRIYEQFGIAPRSLAASLTDTIRWLGSSGQISASALGVLAGSR